MKKKLFFDCIFCKHAIESLVYSKNIFFNDTQNFCFILQPASHYVKVFTEANNRLKAEYQGIDR